MTDITKTDLELFRKYDCHCEVPKLYHYNSLYIYEFVKVNLGKSKNNREINNHINNKIYEEVNYQNLLFVIWLDRC